MRKRNIARLVLIDLIGIEAQHLPRLNRPRTLRHHANANLRSLQILQDAKRPAKLLLNAANLRKALLMIRMRAMAEIQAKHIHACLR